MTVQLAAHDISTRGCINEYSRVSINLYTLCLNTVINGDQGPITFVAGFAGHPLHWVGWAAAAVAAAGGSPFEQTISCQAG